MQPHRAGSRSIVLQSWKRRHTLQLRRRRRHALIVNDSLRQHSAEGAAPYLVFAYQGQSMLGTFRAGDLLWAVPVAEDAIRPGDVIAFFKTEPTGTTKRIAHRVKRGTVEGFVTQGDGDPLPDSHVVSFERVIGRVELVLRNGQIRPVLQSRAGRLWAAHLSLRRKIKQVGRWPYRALRNSGVVRRFWRPRIEQIRFASAEGASVKYIHRQRTVARWSIEKGQFWCRKPYDLFIDHPGEKQSR